MTSPDRLVALERMLADRPDDPRLRFGLALEYVRRGRPEDGIRELRRYLSETDDEGNGWGRLGSALLDVGRPSEAREAYQTGVEAAMRHGHPTMAEEFRDVLEDIGS